MDSHLDAVRAAPSVLSAMHRSLDLLALATTRGRSGWDLGSLDRAIDDPADALTAIAAIHVLGRLPGARSADLLADRLDDPRAFVREHAVWAFGARPSRHVDDRTARAIIDRVIDGGLSGMLAQLTMERLIGHPGPSVDWLSLLDRSIARSDDPVIRARLVESVGLVPGTAATGTLARVALHVDEPEAVRVAAIGALGDRPGELSLRTARSLAGDGGAIGGAARLAVVDLLGIERPPKRRGEGLRVGQLYLHAELDPDLTTAGMGETGGIATLLVRLGDALATRPDVASVTTISRGPADRALAGLAAPTAGHAFAAVTLGQGVPAGIGSAWPGLIDARRGIRRILRSHGPLDRLHLRMADVGSLAGSMAARAEGVRTTFSLAPDPHALIAAMERSGTLSRGDFGAADASGHYWFRVALVRRLVRGATDIALFPRPDLEAQLRDLVGVDVARDRRRFTVVPEGIDTAAIDAAAGDLDPAWPDVDVILSQIPVERRGLPLVVTVGRMHEIKGMARVVEAWATDAALSATTNLVVVGGDLDRPSADEAAELARIDAVVRSPDAATSGLVLAGHRSNATVSRLLVAARRGHPGFAGAGGAYVCGSRKEEFGLAIVEALAAGLPVVVPSVGGPATYVTDGLTGAIVDTTVPSAIADGLARALAMAGDTGRARRARNLVRDRFTVEAMARSMAAVYARGAGEVPQRPVPRARRRSASPVLALA